MDAKKIEDKQFCSILVYAVVIWRSALTKEYISDIERVKNSALGIILRDKI